MVVGGNGLNAFTVGGIYWNQLIQSNNPGTFQVGFGNSGSLAWEGDSLHPAGINPLIRNETTALYIANTVIGGEEDPQFSIIKNHSYLNINQILLINPYTNETQLLEKTAEDYVPFHSFITNDLPTGGSFSIKLIDESIAHNLKGPDQYKVKMNKGFLLTSFDFKMDPGGSQLTENNSMYLYKGGTSQEGLYLEGAASNPVPPEIDNREYVRFRYGVIEMQPDTDTGWGHHLQRENIGPSFASSSIIENKFTKIYYSGSFGLVNEPAQPQGTYNRDIIRTSGLGSASRFIGLNTLKYLRDNNLDPNLTRQEKTELHITFFEGTKDFSLSEKVFKSNQFLPTGSSNDERSISTFEVDQNQTDLDKGGICNDYLPKTHEIRFKAPGDDRFQPRSNTFGDVIKNAYITGSATLATTPGETGCVSINEYKPGDAPYRQLQLGISLDTVENMECYVQGGILGPVGYESALSASHPQYGKSLSGSMSSSNYYSGSFRYQMSFLDKDHTIITNIDKPAELFDGIGQKGLVIVPRYIHPKIKNNINYYLQQAGIIDSSPNSQIQLSNDVN